MIRTSLAREIISKVRKLLDEDLIIVDINGMIIASTDKNRVGTFHEGALKSYRERRKITITKEDEDKLSGVKAGINLPIFFKDQIIGIIGITGDPAKVSPYGELLRKMTELLIKESYYYEQLEWESRTLEAFVFDWIQQKEWSTRFINQSNLLGIDLTTDRQVIIGHFLHSEDVIPKELWHQGVKSYIDEQKDIFVRWGNERFILLRSSTGKGEKGRTLHFLQHLQKYIKETYRQSPSFGVGQAVSSHELYQSFEQAERALAATKPNQTIVFDEDLRLDMVLQDIKRQTRYEFVHRTLAPIISEPDLIETLNDFISHNQSIKETASSLHIHVNTLHYRLKKIEMLTFLNPRDFHDMSILYLALLFLDDYLKIISENE